MENEPRSLGEIKDSVVEAHSSSDVEALKKAMMDLDKLHRYLEELHAWLEPIADTNEDYERHANQLAHLVGVE